SDEVERLQGGERSIEVVGEVRRTVEVGEGRTQVEDGRIAKEGEPITRPVFLPGYRSWEIAVGHHDELTDIFFLGLVLASFSCGLDLGDAEDLEIFVANRENLFAVHSRLNPVV